MNPVEYFLGEYFETKVYLEAAVQITADKMPDQRVFVLHSLARVGYKFYKEIDCK